MKWIDFQCIATEQGLEDGFEIDAIEMIGKRFDVSFTDESGNTDVIAIEEDENEI